MTPNSLPSTFIEQVIREKKVDLKAKRSQGYYLELRKAAPALQGKAAKNVSFLREKPFVIAEVKYRSPSQGKLCSFDLPPEAIASSYHRLGIKVISVLTENVHFAGSVENFARVRSELPEALLLWKDFICSAHQIFEAFVKGADLILLMASILSKSRLRAYITLCKQLQMLPLVETHSQEELQTAIACGAQIIGVNNRNLHSLELDFQHCIRMAPRLPNGPIFIAESGITNVSQVRRVFKCGYQGALIGSALMQEASQASKKFLQAMHL